MDPPTEIDVLRLYSNFPSGVSEHRKTAEIVQRIENFYQAGGIPTRGTEAIRIKIKRLITSFKSLVRKRKLVVKSLPELNRQKEFTRNIQQVLDVSTNERRNPLNNVANRDDGVNASGHVDIESDGDEYGNVGDDDPHDSDGTNDSDDEDYSPDNEEYNLNCKKKSPTIFSNK